MGACDFYTTACGKTAAAAFLAAVRDAQYWYGHGGYTGTIAEKSDFVLIKLPTPPVDVEAAMRTAQGLVEQDDPRVRDKWGPAGCIDAGGGVFVFFGFASS